MIPFNNFPSRCRPSSIILQTCGLCIKKLNLTSRKSLSVQLSFTWQSQPSSPTSQSAEAPDPRPCSRRKTTVAPLRRLLPFKHCHHPCTVTLFLTSQISPPESQVFSKLDLHKGYYQVPKNKKDIWKTAIITLFCMFQLLRLPFRLRNDQILGDLPFCFVYVNNILIYSPDLDTHVQHLRQNFDLLCLQGLTISLPKCVFPVS